MVKVQITQKPDFTKQFKIIRTEIARGLVEAGREFIVDNVRMIHERVKPDGSPQQENSPGYKKFKLSTRGHDVPLRYNDVLSNRYVGYSINARPAFSGVPLPTDTLIAHVSLTDAGAVPRNQVVQRLRKMGYGYWGVSKRFESNWSAIMLKAVRRARARM